MRSVWPSGKEQYQVTTNWYIGSSNGNARFFDGEIREVAIWDSALTASQAAALYAETAPSADYSTSVTAYTYDALNRLTSLTDPVGNTTSYTYDYRGLVLTETNEKNATRYYTYDSLGRLVQKTDRNDRVTTYAYDSVGRQTSSSLTLNGRSDRVNEVTYDYLGNATTIKQTGNITDEIFAEFDYNANGLMTAVRRYEEDANDVVTSIAESLYTYNANNAVTSISHKNPSGTQIVQHSYTYNETNNIVEYLNSIDGQTSYDYDFLGQLIGTDHANQTDESYIYDSNGNRITANGSNYTTGDNNELTSDGDYTYTYDAEGNRVSKTNATNRELYTWDHRNRLTTVTQQEWDSTEQEWVTVQTVEYAYDYNNVWIRKVVGDSKTIFIPENYQTTVQIDNGTTSHHYLWTPNQQDKLLADTTTSGILWALTDHLGTIRDVLDGNSSTHLIYDAFGNLISGTNPLLFGYTGKAFDPATKLQNNINRWYDTAIGRWLSIDPIGFEGGDVNLYRYVRNYVINNIDSLGLFAGIVDSIDKKIHPFYCPECHQRFFPRHVKYAGKVTGQTYLHFGILGNARVTITASYGKNWNGWEEKEVKKKIESIFENQQQKDVKIFEADCNGGKIHWLKDSSKPDQDSRRKVTKTWEKSIKKSYRLMKDKTLKENDFLLGCDADVTVNVDIKFTFTASAELQAYHCCNEDS